MAYARQGGSRTFTELLKNAGLESPFDEKCLRGVCEAASACLAGCRPDGDRCDMADEEKKRRGRRAYLEDFHQTASRGVRLHRSDCTAMRRKARRAGRRFGSSGCGCRSAAIAAAAVAARLRSCTRA